MSGKNEEDAGAGLMEMDTCATATGTSGTGIYHCYRRFAYRSGEAKTFYRELDERLHDCLQNKTGITNDQPVNHPDYFLLRTFHLDSADVSISLKDKAAIEKTLVFMRVETPGFGSQ